MKKTWKKISSKKVLQTPWFFVDEERLLTPAGKELTYYSYRKPLAAVIVPRESDRFYLIKQFRPTIWKYSWEFPMGVAKADTPLDIAKAELREETGFRAESWQRIGAMVGAPGTSDQPGEIFLAEKLINGEPMPEAGEEDIELAAFAEAQIDDMILRGDIFDGWTIASWYFYKLYQGKNK